MKFILSILLFLSAQAIGQVYTIGNTTIPYSATDFITPRRGANTFFNTQQHNPLPDDANDWADDNHIRFVWALLQPTSAGVYDWTAFDNAVISCIQKGHQSMSFGIITVSNTPADGAISVGGAYRGYPAYVHTAMQGETNKDWIIGDTWVQNWNSNSYLTAWETFFTALANHVNTGTVTVSSVVYPIWWVVNRLDLLGYGRYGEWHTEGIGRDCTGCGPCLYTHACGPTGTVATAASLIRIIDAQKNAFNNIPVRVVTNGFITYELPPQVCHYLATASNAWGRFGWGTYHLASTASYYVGYSEGNTVVYAGDSLRPLIMNRYKEAPIFGEPLPSNPSEVTKGGIIWGDLENQVRLYHVSQFNNNYNYGGSTYLTFRAASKASGYRLQYAANGTMPDSIRKNTNFPLRMIWQNVGIAPLYDSFNVVYEFRQAGVAKFSYQSNFDPRLFLPGNQTVTDNIPILNTVSGTYDLYVIYRDPKGYSKPVQIANTGRNNTDGSYLIRSGIAVANVSAPPPPPPPPPLNNPPTVSAGSNIQDTLPIDTDTLRGIVNDIDGDPLTLSWAQISGPNTATMATPAAAENILTGLVTGAYRFRLTANDGRGGITASDVIVKIVDAIAEPDPPAPPIYLPPTVQIGTPGHTDTLVQFTADSAYLIAHVLTKDTSIQSVKWTLFSRSGQTVGTIVNINDSTTKVTGLTPGINSAGVYQYQFTVTDKAGNVVTATGFRRVTVLPIVPLPLPPPSGPPEPKKYLGIQKRAF